MNKMNRNQILFCFIITLLASCGTSSKKMKVITAEDSKEFSWIENADFNEKSPITYNVKRDNYNEVDIDHNSLSKETLARLPEAKLEDVRDGKKDILAKGTSACYMGEYDRAMGIFDSLYSKYKNHPGYWNQLGSCYYLKGETKKALLYYNKSRGLKKNYAPPINNLGVIYAKDGKYQKALAAFELAVKSNHYSLTPLFNRATINLKFGFLKSACQTFFRIHQKNRDDIDVLNALGTCRLLEGKYKDANKYFSSIDDDYLVRPDISLNYSLSLKLSGDVEKARDVFNDIEKDESKGTSDYYQKVRNYLGL